MSTFAIPGNVEVSGEVLEIRAPQHIVFTYGYESGAPFARGGSRVMITLEMAGESTRLHLTHEFPDEASRDLHVQGWRFQLSLFGNAVLDVVHADVAAKVDAWLGLWAEPSADARAATLGDIAAAAVVFRDRYSLIDGADELSAHVAAAQKFMPGLVLQRRGARAPLPRAPPIADWAAVGADGVTRGQGSNVFVLGPDGKIQAATGFWG